MGHIARIEFGLKTAGISNLFRVNNMAGGLWFYFTADFIDVQYKIIN